MYICLPRAIDMLEILTVMYIYPEGWQYLALTNRIPLGQTDTCEDVFYMQMYGVIV